MEERLKASEEALEAAKDGLFQAMANYLWAEQNNELSYRETCKEQALFWAQQIGYWSEAINYDKRCIAEESR